MTELDRLLTIDDVEAAAAALLPTSAYDYFRSGADGERTLAANRQAYSRWQLWPRVAVDVSRRSLATRVVGTDVRTPILVAPTAYHRLAHPDGEVATARAAAAAGTVFTLSSLATTTIEDVAAGARGGAPWFQLYIHKDRGLTRELVERARRAGHRAIVVTVDTPVLGRRLADVRNGFKLPDGFTMANLVTSMPAELRDGSGSELARYVAARHDPAVTWRDIEAIVGMGVLPVVVKGVLRADDAVLAVQSGASAVVVSNHGARQLDGTPATIDALPDVVAAVTDAAGDRCEVLVDGGIRSGTDVLCALALGARAVLVGRPILWGLAVGGERGVKRVLDLLCEELDRAMALAGVTDVTDVPRDLVRRAMP